MSNGGDFFDLVGKSDDTGEVSFVHGGQPAEHPARHVVTREMAVNGAKAFLRDCGTPLVTRPDRDRAGRSLGNR
jgi:hypothetical protein